MEGHTHAGTYSQKDIPTEGLLMEGHTHREDNNTNEHTRKGTTIPAYTRRETYPRRGHKNGADIRTEGACT